MEEVDARDNAKGWVVTDKRATWAQKALCRNHPRPYHYLFTSRISQAGEDLIADDTVNRPMECARHRPLNRAIRLNPS
jgi:hypothetical protein